jgi:hypothetical protein
MRLRFIVPLLLLAALPATAGEHRLAVSATILTRCALAAGTPAVHCSGANGAVAYRTLAPAGNVVTVEF